MTCDLNCFKSRINRHFLPVGSFKTDFLHVLIFLCTSFPNSMPRNGCSAFHGVNLNLKKSLSSIILPEKDTMLNLDPSKDHGHDTIAMSMLQVYSPSICKQLEIISKLSFKNGDSFRQC